MSCVICQGSLLDRNTVEVKRKGIETLAKHSSRRADGLAEVFQNAESIVLHADCRTKYVYLKGKSRFKNFKPQNVSPREPDPIQEFAFAPVSNDDTKVYIPETTDDYASMHVLDIEDKTNIDTSIKTELTDDLASESYGFDETSFALPPESEVMNDDDMEQKYGTKTIEGNLPTVPTSPELNKSIESINELERIQAAESKLKSYLNDPTKPFPYEHLCVICAKDASDEFISSQKTKNKKVLVSTFTFKESQDNFINNVMKLSLTLPELKGVIQRTQGVDLTEMRARYHPVCRTKIGNLRRKHKKPLAGESAGSVVKSAMEMICRYIEQKNRRHYTVRELLNLTDVYGKGESKGFNVRSIHMTFYKQLTAFYEDKVHFTTATGYNPVITMLRGPGWTYNDENDIAMFYDGGAKKKKPKRKKNEEKIKENNVVVPSATEEDSECGDVFEDGPHSPGDDIYEEQENLDNNSNENTRCDICLSANRKLNVLGEYADIYNKICGDIYPSVTDPFLLCWECRALLKNAQRLLKRVHLSQQILNGEMQTQINCLSAISIATPPTAHISYRSEQIETEIEWEEKAEGFTNYEYLEHNSNEIDVKGRGSEPTQLKDENDDVAEFDSFYGINDDDDDIDPPAAKRLKSSESKEAENDITDDKQSVNETSQPKRSKRLTNKANEDSDEGSDDENPFPNRSTTRSLAKEVSASVKKKLSNKQPKNIDYVIEDEKEVEDEKSSEDSDWAESNMPPPRKYVPKKEVQRSAHIDTSKFCLVQKLKIDIEANIKRIAIQPDEVSEWRERERNTDYFVNERKYRKCDKCIYKYIESNHYNLWHSESNPFLCEICETRLATQAELDSHLADHYFIYECAFCQYRCYGQKHMKHHVVKHRFRHECLLCGKEVSSMESFKEHYKALHSECVCDHCGKSYLFKLDLENHLERFHNRVSCPSCEYTCIGLAKLQRHTATKHPVTKSENAYCVECDKQYATEKLLQQHLKTSSKHVVRPPRPPRPPRVAKKQPKMEFKCPECPKVYSRNYSLKEHINFEHLNKIDFYCNKCDKPFPLRRNYKKHIRSIHEGYKQPKNKICDYCQRAFSSKIILDNHIRTHTGEKPFACPHCDARFAQRIAMKMHVKHIHEGAPRKPAAV